MEHVAELQPLDGAAGLQTGRLRADLPPPLKLWRPAEASREGGKVGPSQSVQRLATTLLATVLVWTAAAYTDARTQGTAAPSSGQASPNATGTGISGRVVDGSTGGPLAGVVVTLVYRGTGSSQVEDSQITDRTGRFLFGGVPATRTYQVQASKPGYLDGALGVDAVLTTPRRVTLADGQWLRDVTIPLWTPSAITGTIVDETGAPAVGVHVGVLERRLTSGVPRFASGTFVRTDDRGVYRIAPLRPGTYAVMVPAIRFSVPAELPAVTPSEGLQSFSELAQPLGFTPDGRLITTTPSWQPRIGPAQHAFPFGDGNVLVLGAGSLPPPPPRADGRRQAYATRFYPAAGSLTEAGLIDLALGEARAGVDVQLQPVPVSRLSGRVEGPIPTKDARELRLMASRSEPMGSGHEVAIALTNATGHFTFLDVPDGQYTIVTGRSARTAGAGLSIRTVATSLEQLATLGGGVVPTDQFFAETPVAIAGADQANVVVRLRQGVSITGRIVIETPADLTALDIRSTSLQVTAEPAFGPAATFDGIRTTVPLKAQPLDFSLGNVLPGEYVLRMYGDSGTAKSIMWGGKDYVGLPIPVTDRDISGVVITVTAEVARAQGTVRAADGTIARDAVVIYFPDDRSRWHGPQPDRLRSVPVKAGEYAVPRMPAGSYYLVAVHEGLADRWWDPAFLDAASRVATRVTIGWGETRTQDLTVVEVPR